MPRRNHPNRTKSTRHRNPQANYRRAVDRSRLARGVGHGVALRAATPGTVVWTVVPFSENPNDGKYRPAVILQATGPHDLLVMPLYTCREHPGERRLGDWAAAGMSRPVAWYPARVVEIPRGDCSHVVGQVTDDDLEALTGAARDHLQLAR